MPSFAFVCLHLEFAVAFVEVLLVLVVTLLAGVDALLPAPEPVRSSGPSRADLKGQNARIDTEVRLQISAEMGHGRSTSRTSIVVSKLLC